MAVKCGNCKDYHENSAGVKQCYGNSGKLPNAELPAAPIGVVAAIQAEMGSEYDYKPPARKVSPVDEIRAAARQLPDVATAYYAIEADGVFKFYRVDRPQDGRWKGYTFVKVQASDDFHAIKNLTTCASILTAIAFDAQKAATDYGHQLGRCGICNRTLTDAGSIERGIGPVCASKVGW